MPLIETLLTIPDPYRNGYTYVVLKSGNITFWYWVNPDEDEWVYVPPREP